MNAILFIFYGIFILIANLSIWGENVPVAIICSALMYPALFRHAYIVWEHDK